MLKQLKMDIKLHKSLLIVPLVLMVVTVMMGFGLCALIMFTTEDPGSWFPMGTVTGLFCLLTEGIIFGFTMAQEFSLALSMGRTRKEFLAAYAMRTLLWQGLSYGLLLALSQLEIGLGNILYKNWPMEELDAGFLFDLRLIAGVLAGGNLLTLFLGSLYSYFGKKVLIPLWFLWLAGCFMMPNVASAEPGDRGYAVKLALLAVPGAAWAVLGLAVAAAMAATVVCLGKKQMVK